MWFFERVGLASHIVALCLKANVGLNVNKDDQPEGENGCQHPDIHPSWASADERNISVKTKWDNPLLHDEARIFSYSLCKRRFSMFIYLFRLGRRFILCGNKLMNNIRH